MQQAAKAKQFARLTATRIPNQVKLKPNCSIRGKTIGIMISTIGTHSNGQANKKIKAITISNIAVGGRSRSINASVIIVGVPNLEKTEPKKFEAQTKTIINVVISRVFNKAS